MVSPLPRRNGSNMWYEGNGPSSLCAGVRNGPVNGATPPRLAAGGSSHTIQGSSSRVACGTNAGVASCGSHHSPPRRISKTSGMSPAPATSSFLDTPDSASASLRQLVRQHPTSSIPNDRRGNTAVAAARQGGWSANAGVPMPSNLVHQRRGVPSEACYVGGSMASRAPTTSGSEMSSPRRMSAQISSDGQGTCTGFLDVADPGSIHLAATSADNSSYARSTDSASIPTSHASSRQARRRHTQDAVFNRAEAPPDLRRAPEAASTSAILGTRSGSVNGGASAPQVRSLANQRMPSSTCPEYAPTPPPTRMVCTPPSRSNATSSLNSSPVARPEMERGRIELHLAERLFPEGSCSTDTNSFVGPHSSQTEVEEASTSADECPATARTSGNHYQVYRVERSSANAQQGNRTRHHRQRTSTDSAQREAAHALPQRNAMREGGSGNARELRTGSSRGGGGASNPMALTREQRRDTTDRPLPMSLEEAEGPPLQLRRAVQTPQSRLPPAPNFPPQAAVAPEPIEKDQKLVELLQLANMSGLGDLDPEHASNILESLSWDVPEALRRLSGISGRDPATARRAEGRRRGGGNTHGDLSEFDLMQLQEQEYNRVFAHEERHGNSHHRRHQADVSQWDEDFHDDLDDIDSGSEGLHPGDLLHDFPDHFDSSIPRAGRLRARALRDEDPAGQLLGSAMLRRGNALAFEHGIFDAETEALHVHALLNVLIRSQDEADLQDALRRSSDEAYSGGFSVPPAEEAIVQRMTRTSQFCEGDEKGQCSICLMDFEVGDSLRSMQCSHRFHMACIDQWLAQSGQCPVCKKQVGIDQ